MSQTFVPTESDRACMEIRASRSNYEHVLNSSVSDRRKQISDALVRMEQAIKVAEQIGERLEKGE